MSFVFFYFANDEAITRMLLTTCVLFFSVLFPLVAEPSIQYTSLQRNSNVLSTVGAGVPLWMAEKKWQSIQKHIDANVTNVAWTAKFTLEHNVYKRREKHFAS